MQLQCQIDQGGVCYCQVGGYAVCGVMARLFQVLKQGGGRYTLLIWLTESGLPNLSDSPADTYKEQIRSTK